MMIIATLYPSSHKKVREELTYIRVNFNFRVGWIRPGNEAGNIIVPLNVHTIIRSFVYMCNICTRVIVLAYPSISSSVKPIVSHHYDELSCRHSPSNDILTDSHLHKSLQESFRSIFIVSSIDRINGILSRNIYLV